MRSVLQRSIGQRKRWVTFAFFPGFVSKGFEFQNFKKASLAVEALYVFSYSKMRSEGEQQRVNSKIELTLCFWNFSSSLILFSSLNPKAKSHLQSRISHFIRDRIEFAGKVIHSNASAKIRDGDVVLTYGRSSVVEGTLLKAWENGRRFSVIVVDGRPALEGEYRGKSVESLENLILFSLFTNEPLLLTPFFLKSQAKFFFEPYFLIRFHASMGIWQLLALWFLELIWSFLELLLYWQTVHFMQELGLQVVRWWRIKEVYQWWSVARLTSLVIEFSWMVS